MVDLKIKEPALRDEVKHKVSDMSGIVISKYPKKLPDGKIEPFLDVRGHNEKIYYDTPAKNWEVVKLNDEQKEVL